ncbi:GNAT family N-acetyltransferase [Kytococcus schroeteri]|uniref:GNAT family N-acetyltransferase n=1 Tax=Kytococcus schroeteri TaxID=138300 RepID=UPI00114301F9|nr:GNAT family protein [Kytococcus schroeteri]
MLPRAMPCLTTDHVVLRAFRQTDVPLVQAVAGDPLIPLITTVPTSGTRADAQAYIARQHQRLTDRTGYSFAIADPVTDEAVGQIGLWLRDIDQGRTSTGYWVAPAFRRRGFVKAALQTITKWALTLDDVHRIELYVEPWNAGSWRAAESCGYTREGLLRSWQQVGDERRDMYVYGRTRGDLLTA